MAEGGAPVPPWPGGSTARRRIRTAGSTGGAALTLPAPSGQPVFGVRADGVETWATVGVYVVAVDEKGNSLDGPSDLYASSLRPDDRGRIMQNVNMPVTAARDAWGLEIVAITAGGSDECEAKVVRGATCTTIQLP